MLYRLSKIRLVLVLGLVIYSGYCSSESLGPPAPDCELKTITENQPYTLAQHRGKVIYVDFWASWCGPCLESFPFMSKMQRELKEQGLEVIAINLDENFADAKAFISEHPSAFTVVIDPDQYCAKAFDVKAMPSSYVIDRNGRIRKTHLGFRIGEAEQLRTFVERLLAEAMSDQQYRHD